jgi:hypothetical protein
MTTRNMLALAGVWLLLLPTGFAEEQNAIISPIMDWGSTLLSSYAHISTLPIRVVDQQTSSQAPPPASSAPPPPASSSSGNAPPGNQPPGSSPPPPKSGSSGAGSPVTGAPTSAPTSSSSSQSGGAPPKGTGSSSTTSPPSSSSSRMSLPPFTTGSSQTYPDVLLQVPTLAVKRIELDVDALSADINLNAQVAGLVQLNAGIHASIQSVNLTITDIGAELELVIRLGHLVDIVQRVFDSLDLVSSSS